MHLSLAWPGAGQPLLLLGPNPQACSEAVLALVSLLAPLPIKQVPPAARAARHALTAAGVRGVARGPYGHVKEDPLGLTQRERQIAEMLAASLSNAQIAQRLQRSERTVAHHVSAVLAKLGVRTRTEVAVRLSPLAPPAQGQPHPTKASPRND